LVAKAKGFLFDLKIVQLLNAEKPNNFQAKGLVSFFTKP